ncbi:MAG: hypothetical protein WDN27_00110 [Candidatus Saccharibacteria bacterium]
MRLKSRIFYWYSAFVVAFIGLTLFPAPDKATLIRYHITSAELRALDFTIIIPEVLIWFAAFYGYQKLYRYSQLIKASKDGRQIAKLARGLLLLSLGLPITTIIGGILSIIAAHNPGFKSASVIVNNYLGVVFPLAAFLWISMGARGLSELSKSRPRLWLLNIVTLSVIVLGVVFCSLIVADHQELRTSYHMSPELVMLTLGIPYMYIWFLGLFSAAELQVYSRKVSGVVYREGWKWLIIGLAGVIFTSILLQYLTTLSTWLTSLALGWILLLLYVLLILLAAAYIVLALGAKKLMKIEEA